MCNILDEAGVHLCKKWLCRHYILCGSASLENFWRETFTQVWGVGEPEENHEKDDSILCLGLIFEMTQKIKTFHVLEKKEYEILLHDVPITFDLLSLYR